MNRRAIANFCVVPTALFLLVIGILHSVVNVSGMTRAIERGDIPARLGRSFIANAAYSGVAMSILGLVLILILPGLRAGSREARRVAAAIGIFVGAVGGVGYLWSPSQPAVLVFLVFGALLAAPLLIWRREFSHV
jgi:hypothetical protein